MSSDQQCGQEDYRNDYCVVLHREGDYEPYARFFVNRDTCLRKGIKDALAYTTPNDLAARNRCRQILAELAKQFRETDSLEKIFRAALRQWPDELACLGWLGSYGELMSSPEHFPDYLRQAYWASLSEDGFDQNYPAPQIPEKDWLVARCVIEEHFC